jgi:hypothetical protein
MEDGALTVFRISQIGVAVCLPGGGTFAFCSFFFLFFFFPFYKAESFGSLVLPFSLSWKLQPSSPAALAANSVATDLFCDTLRVRACV